ncbi:hypothetical protein AcV7_009375 [Taiwanofungus camphoratus]|nr:hypothetical protein AcW2_004079 [Antrodia cinnamomea]KAI0948705.1 hypothetical protein AcV7_009375 [Antrodia cinnamomea]
MDNGPAHACPDHTSLAPPGCQQHFPLATGHFINIIHQSGLSTPSALAGTRSLLPAPPSLLPPSIGPRVSSSTRPISVIQSAFQSFPCFLVFPLCAIKDLINLINLAGCVLPTLRTVSDDTSLVVSGEPSWVPSNKYLSCTAASTGAPANIGSLLPTSLAC